MRYITLTFIFATLATPALADESAFSKGPVFTDYGPVANIEVTNSHPAHTILMHSFDVSAPAAERKPNSTFVSAARFINMHARAGVPEKNIRVAVVVHGKAVHEVADEKSASAPLIAALTEQGVRIIVCGQSAAYYNVKREDLLENVEMALSAMTAHALLQQQGYTINPF